EVSALYEIELEKLKGNTTTSNKSSQAAPTNDKPYSGDMTIEKFVEKHNLNVTQVMKESDKTIHKLDKCPFDHEHKDASLIQVNTGVMGFNCFHASCENYHFSDVRELYEPGYKENGSQCDIKQVPKDDIKNPEPKQPELNTISEDEYKNQTAKILNNKFILDIPDNHFISQYVEWGKTTTDAFEEYHIAGALWLMSVTTEGKVYIPLASDRVYANLWIQIFGESTLSRKTIAVNKARKIYETVKGEILLNPDFSRDGLLRELAENGVMPSIRDESSSLLSKMHQKYNDGVFALECQLYDRQSVKKSLAKKEDSITIYHPYICRLYATTPGRYTKIMKVDDYECGWGYRWLHVFPMSKRERRPLRLRSDDDVDKWTDVLNRVKKQFNYFYNRAEFPMGISDDAFKLFQDITMGLEDFAVERDNPYFNGIIGRGNDHILKIAMLYELGKHEISLEVQIDSIIFATQFVTYCMECELELINNLLENVEVNKVEKVLHAIKRSNGSITHSKLLKNVRMFKNDINKSLEVLIEGEVIEVVNVKSSNNKVAKFYKLIIDESEKIDFRKILNRESISGIDKFVKFDNFDKFDQFDVNKKDSSIVSNLSNLQNLTNLIKCDKCTLTYPITELVKGPAGLKWICHTCQAELIKSGGNGNGSKTRVTAIRDIEDFESPSGIINLSAGEEVELPGLDAKLLIKLNLAEGVPS
ncbi:MAG: hypothetical protein MIO93_14835, partial [ANME-2 cluster archaeon]|nr:hypothetical protein [ANME-2 cluster archaeon]